MTKEVLSSNKVLAEGEYFVISPDTRIEHNHKLQTIRGDVDLKIDYVIGTGGTATFITISTKNEGGGNYLFIDTDDETGLGFNSFEEIERCINDFKTKYKLLIPNSKLI